MNATTNKPHAYKPDHSGWGRSSCECGLAWRPRMSDSHDATWLISLDGGKTWDIAPSSVPPCTR